MKLSILKLSLPAVLLCFAGSSLADTAPNATMPAKIAAGGKANAGTSAQTVAVVSDIGKKVQQKLASDKRLKNARIETDVSGDGSVLLRGTVASKVQSRIAEQLASTVTGVNKVRNELQVPAGE